MLSCVCPQIACKRTFLNAEKAVRPFAEFFKHFKGITLFTLIFNKFPLIIKVIIKVVLAIERRDVNSSHSWKDYNDPTANKCAFRLCPK